MKTNPEKFYKKHSTQAAICLSLILAAGCAPLTHQNTDNIQETTPKPASVITSNDLVQQAPEAPSVPIDIRLISRIGELPAQPLIEKGCGLFLWASLPERKLVFYTDTETSTALMSLDNIQTALPKEQASGLSYVGIPGEQTFKGSGLSVKLNFTAQQTKGFTGGAIVRQATLRLKDAEGWEVVIPVAGLIGCNNA